MGATCVCVMGSLNQDLLKKRVFSKEVKKITNCFIISIGCFTLSGF